MTRKLSKIALRYLLLIAIVLAIFYLAHFAGENELIKTYIIRYGYTGLFITAIVSGFNLAVPIPAVAFLPLFIESGLQFWPSILIISIGVTIADVAAYFLGKFGWHIFQAASENKTVKRLQQIRERYARAPLIILLIFASLAPIPNEVLVIPLAFLGYRMRVLLPIVFVGNFIFNSLYATGALNIFGLLS